MGGGGNERTVRPDDAFDTDLKTSLYLYLSLPLSCAKFAKLAVSGNRSRKRSHKLDGIRVNVTHCQSRKQKQKINQSKRSFPGVVIGLDLLLRLPTPTT